MDIDNLRAIRATLVWAMQDRFFAPRWQFTYGDGISAIRYAINEMDAILPVVTDAEALAALCA